MIITQKDSESIARFIYRIVKEVGRDQYIGIRCRVRGNGTMSVYAYPRDGAVEQENSDDISIEHNGDATTPWHIEASNVEEYLLKRIDSYVTAHTTWTNQRLEETG